MPTRHHEVTRLESFSDAVFAFSLTVLVVPVAGFMYALMGPFHAWNGTMQGRAMRRLAGAHAGAPATTPSKKPGHEKR